MAKKREPDLTVDEYFLKLREIAIPELTQLCDKHGIVPDSAFAYAALETLSEHAKQCSCPTALLRENYFPFEAQQKFTFSFDGENAVINLDKPFIMPNLETLVEVLLEISQDSYHYVGMLSGDEISVGELLANSRVDEIEIDGAAWRYGKPCYEAIDQYAFAGNDYVIIGGSGSPGADDSGVSMVCQLRNRMWIYASDPGDWHDLGVISREAAIEYFHNDHEFMWNNPDQYEYSEWVATEPQELRDE